MCECMFNVCVRMQNMIFSVKAEAEQHQRAATRCLCVWSCVERCCAVSICTTMFLYCRFESLQHGVCFLYFKCVYCEWFSQWSAGLPLSVPCYFNPVQCLFVTLHKYFGESAAAKSFFFRWGGEQTCWRRLRFLNRPQQSCCSKDTNTMNTA